MLPGLQGQGTNLAPLFDETSLGAAFKNRSYTNYPVCTPLVHQHATTPKDPTTQPMPGCMAVSFFGGSNTDRS